MPTLTFQRPFGADRVVEATAGSTVMLTAVGEGLSEIVAECGGNLACATCHVYVVGGPIQNLVPIQDDEEEMLDCTASPREPSSRLSCQLAVTDELDGLVVRIAPAQY